MTESTYPCGAFRNCMFDWGHDGPHSWEAPPAGTRLVLMTEELFEQLGADRIDWHEPDEHGWYSPTVYRADP